MPHLGHLPRMAILDLLIGQSISAATILWTELAGEGKCGDDAEELVDNLVLSSVQLDNLRRCLKVKA